MAYDPTLLLSAVSSKWNALTSMLYWQTVNAECTLASGQPQLVRAAVEFCAGSLHNEVAGKS